jgi:hypothetical protein
MGGLVLIGFIFATLAALDLLAARNGVDSRPGFGDERAATGFLAA